MPRWPLSLAFVVFLLMLTGLLSVAYAATEPRAGDERAPLWQGYPPPATTQPAAYPGAQVTPGGPTIGNPIQIQVTPTVNPAQAATSTIVPTPTSAATRTITPTPTRTAVVVVTATPLFVLPTATPIGARGLPVPGPGDRLPATGGSMLPLLWGLIGSGIAGAALFVIGRGLRRRS